MSSRDAWPPWDAGRSGNKRKQARLLAANDPFQIFPICFVTSSGGKLSPHLKDLPTPRGTEGLRMGAPLLSEQSVCVSFPS